MSAGGGWVGAPVPRKEDEALLTGHARFIDDMEPVPDIRHAALLRSPHAHAEIRSVDVARAAAHSGVHGVLTGAHIAAAIGPIPSAVRVPIDYYPIALEKVRYAGEPVALVAADDRYVAEDALELIEVDYRPLPPVIDLKAAMAGDAALLHEAVGSNVVHRREFRYGDPETAFAEADRIVRLDWTFPRYSSTPMETYGAVAQFEPAPDRYTIWSNFQGPFILHALMSGALGVPGNRLRLITAPQSGGSFGIKQGMYPYLVLLAAASRLLGAPLKWIEDRLEHLVGSSSASNREDAVEAAFLSDGTLTGLSFRNVVDVGAYIRAPEPASVYRMHSASNGAYRVRNIAVDNRLVTTNRLPIGLNRGYGGPQFFFALERAMDAGARALGIDIAEIRRRNFVPRDAFPYCAPAGAIYDAGDYEAALDRTLELAGYDALRAERDRAKAEGRLFGIGLATAVEPSGSNMAYVTLAQTPEERARAGGRSGGLGTCTISIDPSGSVTVKTVSTPAGQGHATVAAQVAADALGLAPDDIDVVTEIDTLTGAWSLASGNYANRFSSVVVDAIGEAARSVAEKIRKVAAEDLEVAAEDVELADGAARVVGVPEKSLPFRRVAAKTHWHPAGLPDGMAPGVFETAILSPPGLGPPDEQDRVASAVTFGFICDLAAVEIDPGTGRIEVRKYVSVHDVGAQLNPLIVEGQIVGGFAHGIAGALMEEMVYDKDGNPLSGSFADYLCITAPEMPKLTIGHVDTPSPHTALGAKGMGDGCSMLAPTAIANAVADALGREDVEPPFTLNRLWSLAAEAGGDG
ncbi:MAG: xanthine dehydrogenase family protein molybdopterin-binding subunit [Defluviicoccus sp.]|nr:xanthine dehydrogenase family protein molybdopterin-binding subunit [Defluviicoccus sp.]